MEDEAVPADHQTGERDRTGLKRRGATFFTFDGASYRFSIVLFLLFVSYFFVGVSPAGRFGPLLTIVIEAITLLVTMSAAGPRRIVFIIAIVCSITAVLTGIAHTVAGSADNLIFTSSMSAVLVFVAPVVIAMSAIRRRTLDVQSVLAALCLYVMIGFFFTYLFSVVQSASGHPFFAQIHHGQADDFLYFSFATITTVGYGDLTAATGFGRSLADFEAMVGQLYLVTVVALLVSNLGAARAARMRVSPQDEGNGLRPDSSQSN